MLLCLWDHLRMIILLDRSWKPETSVFVYKSGERTRTKITRRKRLLQEMICVIVSHKLCLGPRSASLICTDHWGGGVSYPHRWCWWSPACCRGCTRSGRTQPRYDTRHWCTGWTHTRWYLKHRRAHTWGQSWFQFIIIVWHTHNRLLSGVCVLTFTGLWFRLENKAFRTEACVGARSVSALAVVTEQTVHQTLVDVCQREETESLSHNRNNAKKLVFRSINMQTIRTL